MVGRGYISGDLHTSDGLAKSLHIFNSGYLLYGDISRVVTEERKKEIRRKIPASKHYVVYHDSIQGGN